jgi:hypothetical protein
MKAMASAFLGRASAYDEALRSRDPLALKAALTRNLYGTSPIPDDAPEKIAQDVMQCVSALENGTIDAYSAAKLPFPAFSL